MSAAHDLNARIAAIEERRPGFGSVVSALIDHDLRTGQVSADLAARVQNELDAGAPCSAIVEMIETAGVGQ